MSSSTNDIAHLVQQNGTPKAVDDDKLHIFVSHKNINKKIAADVKKRLLAFGGKCRMEIFLSEEIPSGEKWNADVHAALKRADWLIFIYTNPSLEWDWCMYETGFFAGKNQTSNSKRLAYSERLVCLYATNAKIPAPLKEWQAVPAKEEDIKKLLKRIYGEEPRPGVAPIRPDVTDEDSSEWVTDNAKLIASSLKPAPDIECFSNYLTLYLNQSQIEEFKKKEGMGMPEGVIIDGNFKDNALSCFDLKPGEFKWSAFYDTLKESSQDGWVNVLCTQLSRIINKKPIHNQILPTFTTKSPRAFYAPVIHRLERVKGSYIKLWLLFLPTTIPPPKEIVHTHPHIRIVQGYESRIVDATPDAEALYGQSPLNGMSLLDMVDILKENMPQAQKDAFVEEQINLIGKLGLGIKQLNATVCIIFSSQPDKLYLPIITKYFKRQGESYIDVIYLNVSSIAKTNEAGIKICKFE